MNDQRQSHISSPITASRVLRKSLVANMLGLSISTLDRLRHDSQAGFPDPIRLGQQAIGWLASDIEAFIATRPRVTLH